MSTTRATPGVQRPARDRRWCGRLTSGRRWRFGIVAVMVLGSWGVGHVRAELLDRVIAVVGNRPILDSDVRLARDLGLVEALPGGQDGDILTRLVDRVLMLDEVDRLGPGDPEPAEVDARLDAIRDRVGAEILADILERSGVPEPALRTWLRDELRIERYLMQRFDAVAQATVDEVSRYYDEHPEEFTIGGTRRPLADVEMDIQQKLAASRRAELIADWQQALRRRARIQILPADGVPPGPDQASGTDAGSVRSAGDHLSVCSDVTGLPRSRR